jgi:hypothetical protein
MNRNNKQSGHAHPSLDMSGARVQGCDKRHF